MHQFALNPNLCVISRFFFNLGWGYYNIKNALNMDVMLRQMLLGYIKGRCLILITHVNKQASVSSCC